MYQDLQARLRSLGNRQDAAFLAGFFQTGPGQYGEGDEFIGVRVPVIRKVAREFLELPLAEAECLLHGPIHEERLAALVILVAQTAKGDAQTRKAIYDLYLANTRRINILATFHFIRSGDFSDTLGIAEVLLSDREDLIHKAVGWMLREVGKRDVPALEDFLARHSRVMPRTMLRYAIERFSPSKRKNWLKPSPARSPVNGA